MRMEWSNRMKLEQFGKTYKPMFVTLTYAPAVLPNNNREALQQCQRYLKRLRKRLDSPIRYFLCTELGSKKGRIHNHMLLWSEDLAKMSLLEQWKIQHKTWGNGRLESEPIRHQGGIDYVAKYISKNLTDKDTGVWNRYEKKFVNEGRLYTWSNKPVLGTPGLDRWRELSTIYVEKFNTRPPNWMNIVIYDQLKQVYIPSDQYRRHCLSLGLQFKETEIINTNHIKPANIIPLNPLWLNVEKHTDKSSRKNSIIHTITG